MSQPLAQLGADDPTPNHVPPPVRLDLGKLLKEKTSSVRVLEIRHAKMGFLILELRLLVAIRDSSGREFRHVVINCINAVDYSVRPKPPATIEGGREIEYHEEHPKLQAVSQCVPHSDGLEYFDPPIRFKLLILEDTYVIAERFELLLESA